LAATLGRRFERLTRLGRPHYVFSPAQVAHRLAFEIERPTGERRSRLPWGATISYDPGEAVGGCIARCGVFDLLVCETLLRLADAGETSVDVGANIGQMSSVLAHAIGPTGRVIAFEPHPIVFERLSRNVRAWAQEGVGAAIDARQLALSDHEGEGTLSGRFFAINQGCASLQEKGSPVGDGAATVVIKRLDRVLAADCEIGVMKIDIEGHELAALRGADALLASGRIRDIVFEERGDPPTPVTELLANYGYSVFRLTETLRGPLVAGLDRTATLAESRDDPSFLATRAPERSLRRLQVRGWAVYRAGPARIR
jgi:FkbM family methyltransferase